MITNATIRKDLKNEQEKIASMSFADAVQYMKNLMLQMSRLVNKENNLLRKKKYTSIKEDSAWAKVKLSNTIKYCCDFLFKMENIKNAPKELLEIQKDFNALMVAMQENKLHIMRVSHLQEMVSLMETQHLTDEAYKNFGYDTKAQYLSSKDPLKYSRPVSTNQYT